IISELVKVQPAAGVLTWIREAQEDTLFLSAITIGELEKGIAKLPRSSKKARLETWVRINLAERFAGRILPIDSTVAARWGSLVGEWEQRGRSLPVIDSLIAATSLSYNLRVVTRNSEDFERCGVACINPWES